jgi:Tfp pilus assembly protein PilZ
MTQKSDHERRVATRVPAMFKVSFVHDGDYLISTTRDISVDGMFLFTENPANIGDTITLTFSLGELSDADVNAAVVWINRSGNSKDRGMAVKFIKPVHNVQKAILKIVNKVAVLPEL